MALPKLDTPVYNLEVPSTGETIKYRPFLVKEQKILMMAEESKDENELYNAMSNIISSCTFNQMDVHNSPIFDVEYVFVRIRGKSVGESVKLKLLCPDDKETYAETVVNLDDIEVQVEDGHTNVIEITDTIKMIMKYPTLENAKTFKGSSSDVFDILKNCIHEVHHDETIHHRIDITDKDIEEFIEGFTVDQFQKVTDFFETMPKLRHFVELENPKTKVKSEVLIEGIDSFLA
jgi:hypothetical protein